MMGGRSCNNIWSLGGKKSKGSVMATAAVTVTVMTTTTIRKATTVKAHDQPSGVGCLPPIAILPQSADASVAFNGVMIAGANCTSSNTSRAVFVLIIWRPPPI
jgi:hypothetical protein